MNNTIANSDDAAVRQVEDARAWPEDVDSYAALMDEEAATPVAFTKEAIARRCASISTSTRST